MDVLEPQQDVVGGMDWTNNQRARAAFGAARNKVFYCIPATFPIPLGREKFRFGYALNLIT